MKLQKLMLDGGFSCPNRDGHVGTGGCTFCRTDAFNPSYCRSSTSIYEQLEAGKHFFAGKYPDMKYLAYFQAYSNTYAPLDVLRHRYEEALSVEDVVGLVIGTRPDCIEDDVLQYLADASKMMFCNIWQIFKTKVFSSRSNWASNPSMTRRSNASIAGTRLRTALPPSNDVPMQASIPPSTSF